MWITFSVFHECRHQTREIRIQKYNSQPAAFYPIIPIWSYWLEQSMLALGFVCFSWPFLHQRERKFKLLLKNQDKHFDLYPWNLNRTLKLIPSLFAPNFKAIINITRHRLYDPKTDPNVWLKNWSHSKLLNPISTGLFLHSICTEGGRQICPLTKNCLVSDRSKIFLLVEVIFC